MKTALLSIILASLSYFSFSQNNIYIKLDFPEKITANKTLTVNLKITKPENISPFATFTQKFPDGFFIKPLNIQNADFSFKNNTLTISWIKLPKKKTINIFYNVSFPVGTEGIFNLNGKFVYIINGKKGEIKTENKTLEIISEPEKTHNLPGSYKIKCKRTAIPLNEGKTLVKLKISGNSLENFILTEEIPPGYKINIVQPAGTKTKVNKRIIQFFAYNVSAKKEFIIKYEIIPDNKNSVKKPVIYGKLAFKDKENIINIPVIDSP